MTDSTHQFSFSNPEVMACPFPHYRRLQREAPVFHDPVTGLYEVTSQELIREITAKPLIFSNKTNRQGSRPPELLKAMMALYQEEGFVGVPSLLNNDPPDHRRIRSLVDRAFMPSKIRALLPKVEAEAKALVDAANCAMKEKGEVEFVSEFAISMPINMIADQLGVPRGERETIKLGSDAMIAVADPLTPDDMILELTRRIIAMQNLLKRRVDLARECPDETILSTVANGELDGEPVPIRLLIHLFQSLLVAGNETTTNALSNGMVALLDRPELFAELSEHPERVPAFVEESLRFLAPFQGFYRYVMEDTVVAGIPIKAGSTLMLRWGAGNHDEAIFTSPEQFDLDRPNISKQTTFGAGIHFCIGNLLARAELVSAFTEITRRWRNVRIVGGRDAAVYAHQFFNQGMARLPIAFDIVG